METVTDSLTCPKCHGSGMYFTTEQKGDGFTVSWTPCECSKGATPLPLPYRRMASPVFL